MQTRSQSSLDVAQDVAREEDRLAALLLEDEVAHLFAPDRIEPAHRLVEDEELRIVHERGGEAGALEHALREAAHRAIDRVGDPDALERRLDPAREVRPAKAVEAPAERHELARREVRVDVRVLRQEADAAHRLGRGDRLAEERRAPAVGAMSPVSILIVVVLPAPFGPRKPKISPAPTVNEMPRTASTRR